VSAETFVALPAGATFKANGAVTVSLTSSASSASQATPILPGSAAGLAYKGTGSVSLASGDITLPQGTPPNTDPNVNFPGLSNDWNFYTFRYGPNANPNIQGSGEPGVLTIRAPGNIVLLSSITDGFVPTSALPPPDYVDMEIH